MSGFSLLTLQGADVLRLGGRLTDDELKLLGGTIRNRDLTREAYRHLTTPPLDRRRIGALLTEHQTVLRDVLQISTPKIDGMLEAALSAGAYGGKINGSGGGGAMFAYAPENPGGVARAIERAGGRAFVVSPDEGTRLEIGSPRP
jgi:galactokinase